MMAEAPAWIGLCPNRVGEAKYVVAGRFFDKLDADDRPVCEHCGSPLILYGRVTD
jgi:DNA-directed RNA polymerase subunit RPC12/RpoP